MEKFGKGQSIRRVEDLRFLTGGGRYLDDIVPEGALYAYFLRSSVAHGEISHLDLSEARQSPGVHLVVAYDDLAALGMVETDIEATIIKNRDGSKAAAPARHVLAKGRVRFVGEAIALIVADSPEAARDAAELVGLEIDELPAKVDLAPGGALIHPEAPENIAFDWGMGDAEAVEAEIAKAAHVVTVPIEDQRVIVAPMEPRGCFAEPMDEGRLHVCVAGQGVWDLKSCLARAFGVDAETFRITNPDVGGGFGLKAFSFPEYYVIAAAARHLGRPVRWMSDRSEAMLTDHGGRAVNATCTLAFDKDLKITAYKVESLSDLGAYNSENGQIIQTELWAKVLMGTYAVQKASMRVLGIYTNTVQTDAYRGAGRPEAIYALERMMDYAARELGTDGWELRRRNFIAKDQFPYVTATGETYDVGDFHGLLDQIALNADLAGYAARKAASAEQGLLRGQGLCFYIESILGSPVEHATVEFLEDGSVNLYVGTQSNGQGHETVFAKFLSDQTGIPLEKIHVVQGDSDRIAQGGGTGGSRSVTTQNNATLVAVETVISGFGRFLAELEGADAAGVRFDDERFRIPGSNFAPTMTEAAELARSKGRDDLLKVTGRGKLPGRSYPNGAHVCEVEIDPATGFVHVDRYTVLDDFGNLINPMLATGQVHGGVAQGLGQALVEQAVYNEDGQLLSASFMDYAMPRAKTVPFVEVAYRPVPSTANPLGMKGCGEAGTVGSMAAVANACLDALWERGIRRADMPFTPHKVWQMLQGA